MGKRYTEEVRLAERYTQKKEASLGVIYTINCTKSTYIVTRIHEAGTTCNIMPSTITDVNVDLTKLLSDVKLKFKYSGSLRRVYWYVAMFRSIIMLNLHGQVVHRHGITSQQT